MAASDRASIGNLKTLPLQLPGGSAKLPGGRLGTIIALGFRAMRRNVGLALLVALCGCGKSETAKPAADAASSPQVDGLQEAGKPDGTPDAWTTGQDTRPDVWAGGEDAGADVVPGGADAQLDVSTGPLDALVGRDGSGDGATGPSDSRLDPQEAGPDSATEAGLDGGGCSSLDECVCLADAVAAAEGQQ